MSRALALKWRPKTFRDLIGQEAVSQTLSLSLQTGKLSHAYLFSGLRGSGKTSTARIFAKALVCEKAPTSEPCEVCAGCIAANEGRHIDIIEMDAASNRGIDDVRALIENTKYRPSLANYKVFILDEAHMLSLPAFNALLKTLEEPPEYVKFIFATTDPLKLPATILSRTLHFRFNKIPKKAVVAHLEHILATEKVEYEKEALEILARSAEGSLRDTLTLLDQAIVYGKGSVELQSVTDMLGLFEPSRIEELFAAITTKDRKRVLALAKELADYDAQTVLSEISGYLKDSLFDGNQMFAGFALDRFLRIASDARALLYGGADGEFVICVTLLKMLEALEVEEIDSLIASYEQQLSKTNAPAPTVTARGSSVAPKPEVDRIARKWTELIQKIHDRDYKLGCVFERCVRFVGYENDQISWSSDAQGEDRKTLRDFYTVVKHIVQEVYGQNTQIVLAAQESVAVSPVASVVDVISEEDAKRAAREEILNHPTVRRAIELFEPSSVEVVSKS